jgi:2-polyprenyl-6-methoxyphenol hydroxylase-like FAD-dependent oxidoreductase
MPKRAVIAGCGVAGPALALFLQRIGWQPVIYEDAAEPDDYAGLFLNVATNGLAVHDDLGLSERVLADVHRCPHMVMWSGRGGRLGQVPQRSGRRVRPVRRRRRAGRVGRRRWRRSSGGGSW